MNWNNYNSNWKKLLGFRNMREKLENELEHWACLGGFSDVFSAAPQAAD